MQQVKYTTTATKLLADVYTPVGIYLRVRDSFRDSVLLESTNFEAAENAYSFIGINALAGFEVKDLYTAEYRLPNEEAKMLTITKEKTLQLHLEQFMQCFVANTSAPYPLSVAQGLIGYMSYNAVQLFEEIAFQNNTEIPNLRFRFYQYIIAINHFKDELHIIENKINGVESNQALLETILQKKDIPQFPYQNIGVEQSNMKDEDYKTMVTKGIAHCKRGDVFQVVLSRKFEQSFMGDEFNVYRSLRSINPSPYLFYFDYGDYRLFGSSPESQLIIQNEEAVIHPIAGTVKRTGDVMEDEQLIQHLKNDAKENAEHTMLVDLARNDLSIFCTDVKIAYYKKVQQFSHLIHLVSEVKGSVQTGISNIFALGKSFPAGTLSGAPKYKAMQIIETVEPTNRGYYGGAIGFLGFNGATNMAIMIRTFLSKNNTLTYQAGAGIVAASNPERELQEVNNKVAALRKAMENAEKI